MTIQSRLKLIIFSGYVLFLVGASIIFAQETSLSESEDKLFSIEADYLAYSVDDNILTATGKIVAILGKIKINADSLQLDINQRLLQAQGNVTISRGSFTTEGIGEGRIGESPDLEIKSPPPNLITNNPNLKIEGNVTRGGEVYIDEEKISVSPFGEFEHQIILNEGINKIEIMALSPEGEKVVLEREVLLDSAAPSIIQGDALKFDLNLMQGSVYKVEDVIEITYFIGENLQIISTPIKEIKTRIEIPDLTRSHLSLVAKRMRIILGERMEAWKVSFWVKGIKALSLPYYTSGVEESLERLPDLPLHIKFYHLDYSSKEGFGFKSLVYYSSHQKSPGILKLNYKSKYQKPDGQKEEKWKANLEQHFSFGEKKQGVLYISNLGERLWRGNLSYRHFFSQSLETSIGANYNRSQSLGFNLNCNLRFTDSDLTIQQRWNKNLKTPKYETEYFKLIWNLRPTFIEGTRIGYYTNMELSYYYNTRQKNKDWKGSFGVNLYKSGIHLNGFSFLDLSGNFKETISFPNQQSTNLQGNVGLNLKFGRQNFLSLTYSTSWQSQRRDKKVSTFSHQRVGGSLSMSRKNIYRSQITTSYDLKSNKFYDINPNIEVRLNKLLRGRFQTSYQFNAKPEWKFFRFNFYYKLFGEGDNRRLQFLWEKSFTPKKEKFYWIRLSSMI